MKKLLFIPLLLFFNFCFSQDDNLVILGNQILTLNWGGITGTLSNQTDLQNALNLKLNISDSTKYVTPTQFSAFYSMPADYVIDSVNASTVTATARIYSGLPNFSGFSSAVFDSVKNRLEIPGSQGSHGGKVFINRGTFQLAHAWAHHGWEGSGAQPYSQIVVQGCGRATKIQMINADNAITADNNISICLLDLDVSLGSSAKSAFVSDTTGANSITGVSRCYWNNVYFASNNASYPCLWLKNFTDLVVGYMEVENPAGTAIWMYNSSTTNTYGNSDFQSVRCIAGTSSPAAALKVTSINSTHFINLVHFGSFQAQSNYYAIATDYARYFTFDHVDLEQCTKCIFLGGLGAGSANRTEDFNFYGGYIGPNTGGTSITNTTYAGGNYFTNIQVDGDGTSIPISDQSANLAPNTYTTVHLGFSVNPANISITNPATLLSYTNEANYTTTIKLPVLAHTLTRVSATGTYSATGSDCTIVFTGSTATLVYPTVNLIDGRHLNLVNQASGSITIPTTTIGNGSTSTTMTTGQNFQVEYDLTNAVWRKVN
jgi:hypothetical protein